MYYVENDPRKPQLAAKLMIATALEPEVQPRNETFEDYREEAAAKRRKLEGKHPCGGENGGAEVSVYNCIDIVHAYRAKVLGESFQTDALCQWTAAGEPPEEQ